MTGQFRDAWRGSTRAAGAHEAVTLASLVEKEGKLPEERPRIAAVFENRLRIGMKLDCDPTTIYAALLDDRYRGTIYRSDLDRDNPYNTYRHAGLPPGPIANPGLASIRAALAPRRFRAPSISCCGPMAPAGTSSPPISPRTKPPSRGIAAWPPHQIIRQAPAARIPRPSAPPAITEAVWHDLLARLAPVSESYLRDLLRATGLPFEQPYAGIRQHTFEELEHRCARCWPSTRMPWPPATAQRARYSAAR